MQRLPAVKAGTPAIPGPEDGADLEPPTHDTSPPVEAAEPPDCQSPKQIRAPTDVGEPLESLRGEVLWRTMGHWQMRRRRAHQKARRPSESAKRPPDLPNLQTKGSAFLAPESVEPMADVRATQARWPVPYEGSRVRPDPWPNPGIVIINLDFCSGSTSLLERKQKTKNKFLPRTKSKQYASPCSCISHILLLYTLSFDVSPFDTFARKNSPEEGAASEWRTADFCPNPWKLPELHVEGLEKSGEHQHSTTHLPSLAARKALVVLDLDAWSRKPTQG